MGALLHRKAVVIIHRQTIQMLVGLVAMGPWLKLFDGEERLESAVMPDKIVVAANRALSKH